MLEGAQVDRAANDTWQPVEVHAGQVGVNARVDYGACRFQAEIERRRVHKVLGEVADLKVGLDKGGHVIIPRRQRLSQIIADNIIEVFLPGFGLVRDSNPGPAGAHEARRHAARLPLAGRGLRRHLRPKRQCCRMG